MTNEINVHRLKRGLASLAYITEVMVAGTLSTLNHSPEQYDESFLDGLKPYLEDGVRYFAVMNKEVLDPTESGRRLIHLRHVCTAIQEQKNPEFICGLIEKETSCISQYENRNRTIV